ncbi:MAG: GNAT family N-acetyltransferase [Planctomycetes bacterium]|nr:GNAT family N-acetyltransferase [Planctomycetota bacterium]
MSARPTEWWSPAFPSRCIRRSTQSTAPSRRRSRWRETTISPSRTSPGWRSTIRRRSWSTAPNPGAGSTASSASNTAPPPAFSTAAIAEREARNRGTGTEAVRTMLRYLFEVKRCHRVTIDPQTGNARAIRCYENAGFRLDGVLRHNDRISGRYVDTHAMSMLEDEWPTAKEQWEAERAR